MILLGLVSSPEALVQCCFVVVSSLSVFLIARLGFGVEISGSAGRFIASFLFVQASIFGIGVLIGSLAPNMKIANALASLLYFPMIFLSGATVPYEVLPRGLQAAVEVFPLTQGIKLIKGAVLGSPLELSLVPIAILSALTVAAYSISIKFFRWD
jgi:ABC-2 type transport system permease protein